MDNEYSRFAEPITDFFELEAWNGSEIFRGEEYLEFQNNGHKVLLEKDTVMEYLADNYEFTLELLDNAAIRKVAGQYENK